MQSSFSSDWLVGISVLRMLPKNDIETNVELIT
jgi:hypothetical protein